MSPEFPSGAAVCTLSIIRNRGDLSIRSTSLVRPWYWPSNATWMFTICSVSLQMVNIQVAFEGQYQGLTKLVDLIDKSPRFLMIESVQTAAPLGNSGLMGVQLKIHTFVRGALEDAP